MDADYPHKWVIIACRFTDLVNEAIAFSLTEDSEDLAAFETRANEPLIAFEDVLKELKANGRI